MEEVDLAIAFRFIEEGEIFVIGPKPLRFLLIQDMWFEDVAAATKHRLRSVLLGLFHEQRDVA